MAVSVSVWSNRKRRDGVGACHADGERFGADLH
ncbi:Hypothetical protein Bdt_3065 [Bdellovibrio bacteriovorus str. Tiberius]|uniref:Uncharacterized protein n=1 Tax=Bdellovibrio bacteriovorus str. Tiberius TaxID=1069642 RepID=K7Z120_BDEBC|nr:Hypothetical protein Bdt_3065 [Bdellovibrio bacteriovorus str. Tiberius]